MRYSSLRRRLPRRLYRYIWFFEAEIERQLAHFAASLAAGARVLDAGAGEGQYKHFFENQRYTAVDLAVGDERWDYTGIDVLGDLTALPFASNTFDAALNIVTLEHLKEPAAALRELGRALAPGGRLLLVAPQDWEVHQAPHDFYRYTRYGLRHLLEQAGFQEVRVYPVGGFFRLLSRRLFNSLQFFNGIWRWLAACVFLPPAILLPLLDTLDRGRDFTLGYTCFARKPKSADSSS